MPSGRSVASEALPHLSASGDLKECAGSEQDRRMTGSASLQDVEEIAGRIDVFARRPRRRTHDADFKARLVAESHRPGAVVSDVARRAGVHPQLLFGWRREARAGRLALPEELLPMFAEAVPGDAEDHSAEAVRSGPVAA